MEKHQSYGPRQSRASIIWKVGKITLSASFIGLAVYFIAYGLGLDQALTAWLARLAAQISPI